MCDSAFTQPASPLYCRRGDSQLMYSADQKNVVKGCVSLGFNHATFDIVFWPVEYLGDIIDFIRCHAMTYALWTERTGGTRPKGRVREIEQEQAAQEGTDVSHLTNFMASAHSAPRPYKLAIHHTDSDKWSKFDFEMRYLSPSPSHSPRIR